jgi:hypothetical protein
MYFLYFSPNQISKSVRERRTGLFVCSLPAILEQRDLALNGRAEEEGGGGRVPAGLVPAMVWPHTTDLAALSTFGF